MAAFDCRQLTIDRFDGDVPGLSRQTRQTGSLGAAEITEQRQERVILIDGIRNS
jgi:hypothetical protein